MYLQTERETNQPAKFWKQVWDSFGLPKINFFFWVLMQKKILTGENMIKIIIFGPHRCALCRKALETMDHLFVDCIFTKDVWNFILQHLNVSVPTQIYVVNLFSTWKVRYPHAISSKSLWFRVWHTIPKYAC